MVQVTKKNQGKLLNLYGEKRTRTCIAFRPAIFKTQSGSEPDPTSTD